MLEEKHSSGYASIIPFTPTDTLVDAYHTKQGQVTCAATGCTMQGQGLPHLSVTHLLINSDHRTN
jgi:hypothetical protein